MVEAMESVIVGGVQDGDENILRRFGSLKRMKRNKAMGKSVDELPSGRDDPVGRSSRDQIVSFFLISTDILESL